MCNLVNFNTYLHEKSRHQLRPHKQKWDNFTGKLRLFQELWQEKLVRFVSKFGFSSMPRPKVTEHLTLTEGVAVTTLPLKTNHYTFSVCVKMDGVLGRDPQSCPYIQPYLVHCWRSRHGQTRTASWCRRIGNPSCAVSQVTMLEASRYF